MPAPKNYTTGINADRTAGEIQKILAKHGASSVSVEYDGENPSGMSFILQTPHGPRHFTLPVDVLAMQNSLRQAYNAGQLGSLGKAKALSEEHARRVAWRVVKDWIDAQMTLVASRMASMAQAMLPYLHTDDGRTLYEAYRDHEQGIEQRMLEGHQ